MTRLIRFLDDDNNNHRASIRMDNGTPCWIRIDHTGILVKKSKIGLFGARLYQGKNIDKATEIARILKKQYCDDLTPDDMRNPVLKSIVNAVLHCSDLAQVARILNEADLAAESRAKSADILTADFFKNSLIILANRLRKIDGLPESDNLKDAVARILTQLISYVQRKVSRFPTEGHTKDSEILTGMVFLYFVGNQLTLHLGDEGTELAINDVVAKAALSVFQFLGSEKVMRVAHAGMVQYKAIIKSGEGRESVRNYTHAVSNGVLAYVMSQDERLVDIFCRLFITLVDVQEK
jgi:hypothetical protein